MRMMRRARTDVTSSINFLLMTETFLSNVKEYHIIGSIFVLALLRGKDAGTLRTPIGAPM